MNFAINGFGRIGRALFRIAFYSDNNCLYINEPYANKNDVCYFLKYDSLYGRFNAFIQNNSDNTITVYDDKKELRVVVSHYSDVKMFALSIPDDVVIVESNSCPEHIDFYLSNPSKKVMFSYHNSKIKREIILGFNDDCASFPKDNVISGSICDTVALAPVLKCVYSCNNIENTLITTMHPALSYQKVIDNYIDHELNRSLGRQYIDSIIPKRTSAEKILKNLFDNNIRCFSYRIPTESVCSADITFVSKDKINEATIVENLQKIKYIDFNTDDLVSIDFKASSASAIVDLRWLEVVDDKILKMVIWYDNEYGYTSRILDLMVKYFNSKGGCYEKSNCRDFK